jgi:GNAT superfamily N-acetyltransferase
MPPTFRYFATRTVDTCLATHTLTLVVPDIAYAHLDDRWIGVCVLPESQGRGIGAFLLDLIIAYARVEGIQPLRLTVDKTNTVAFDMYCRRGFIVQSETERIYSMTNDPSPSIDRRST